MLYGSVVRSSKIVYSGLTMELQAVDSSNVSQIGYNSDEMVLVVIFHNGYTYNYYDVTPAEWESFQNADSKGRYLAENIKGVKSYQRIM